MTDMVDRIADIMIEDHVELMKENKALEAEIERLKDMEQAYLEEVKLRLELEVEVERLREVIEEADRLIERYKPVSAMKLLKAALAGKEDV